MGDKTRFKFPFEIKRVDDALNKQLLEDFTGERTCFVQVEPKKWFFPSKYEAEAEHLYNFKVRKDDIWIITFPRSGTTWTQEMVWLIANNLDYKTAIDVHLTQRSPFLEFYLFLHEETKKEFLAENANNPVYLEAIENLGVPGWQELEKLEGQRIIKTHLPFSLLPPDLLTVGCKIIYVARNPKDVAVSFYHLNKSTRTQGYQGDFEKYWWYFRNNLHHWTPYFEHIKEGWERRNEKNVLFMFYEDMNKNPKEAIRKLSGFLEKEMTEQEVSTLQTHLKIENFRLNTSVNFEELKELGIFHRHEQGFIRKGKNGSWKEMFTEEMAREADEWIRENTEGTDIYFPE